MAYWANLFRAIKGDLKVIRDANGNFSYWLGGNHDFALPDKLQRSLTNPAIFTAFDMRSTMFSRAKIKVLDKDGKEVEGDPAIELFSNPNYSESQQDFLKKHLWFKGLGTSTTKAIAKRVNGDIRDINNVGSLEHLIPNKIEFKDLNKQKDFIYSRTQIKALEDHEVEYKMNGKTHIFTLKEIAFFYDVANNMREGESFKSPSRMDSLAPEITNIEEAQISKNKNLKFSSKWMATNRGQEMSVRQNLENDERDEIENKIFHKSINATNADVNITSLAGDFRKLMLDDNIASDAMRIFNAYGINKDVLNWWMSGQTTYDNKENGVIDWIQNSIQLEGDDFGNTWTNFFNYQEEGKRIVLDYSHLPIMQNLEKKRMDSIDKQSQILERLVKAGVKLDEALRISGLDETEA